MRWIFLAGVTGGLAWCIRNVAVALFAGTVLFLALSALWQPIRSSLKSAGVWLAGWLASAGWLAVRNLAVFGTVSPYHMPPSQRSLWANTGDAWRMIVRGMVASSWLGDVLAGPLVSLPAGAIALAALIRWARRRGASGIREFLSRNRKGLLLGCYAALYCATLIVARTRYRWAERINSRYLVQLYWILWMALAAAAAGIFGRVFSNARQAGMALTVILGLAAAAQTAAQARLMVWHEGRRTEDARAIRDAERLAGRVPPEKLVLSDMHKHLRIHGDINARGFNRPWLGQEPLTMDQIQQLRADGILWGIVIQNVEKCARGDYGPALQRLASQPERPAQFEVVDIGSRTLVLKCEPPP